MDMGHAGRKGLRLFEGGLVVIGELGLLLFELNFDFRLMVYVEREGL